MKAELEKIREGLKDAETLVPVLNAAAASQNIRPKALADLLILLFADLTAVQNSASTSLREIDKLYRKLNHVTGSSYLQKLSKVNMDERREFRKKRRAAGLSQTKLARLAEVGLSVVHDYESGRHNMRSYSMAKITQALADHLAGQQVTASLRSQRVEDHTMTTLTGSTGAEREEHFGPRLPSTGVIIEELARQISRLERVAKVLAGLKGVERRARVKQHPYHS